MKLKNRFLTHSAVSGIAMMAALSVAHAGKITSETTLATGADGWGGWNLGNIGVILSGTDSWFDYETGDYEFGDGTDHSYVANVADSTGTVMGIALAKDWPVGEPPGIKVINDDLLVKAPKPPNCIMATSYLADHFLDSDDPQQDICSSAFQTHKRYKLAMLPTSVDGQGSEGIDLVFNVEPEAGSRDYQIFQKINNWTDGRLEGFSIQVGFGIGTNFKTVTQAGVDLADMNISVPSEIWELDQLAVFSVGLFGADPQRDVIGYFDPDTRAGFVINEYSVGPQPLTDTLTATETLGSDYAEVPPGAAVANQFGPWLPNNMLPTGIFWDDDGNPETDAQLMAWFGYNPVLDEHGWMSGSQGTETNPTAFAEIPAEDITAMGENLAFTSGEIDDLVNVGLSYIVTVGDVSSFPDSTFTLRVTPTKDTSGTPAPGYVDVAVPSLLFTSSDAAVLLDPNPEFVVGTLLTARVGDADLNLDPLVAETVDVTVESSTGLSETITLVEQGEDRGVFALSLDEAFSSVEVGTEVTLTYVDADDGMGGTDIVKTSTTTAVEEPVVIASDVSITNFSVPASVTDGSKSLLTLTITNDNKAAEAASGTVFVTGSDGSDWDDDFTDLQPGQSTNFSFNWEAELEDEDVAETVTWSASVVISEQIVDEATAVTLITTEEEKGAKKNEGEENVPKGGKEDDEGED
ncbi:MAG: choice-of-anchor F family protein [Pseudomonadota bacterium]